MSTSLKPLADLLKVGPARPVRPFLIQMHANRLGLDACPLSLMDGAGHDQLAASCDSIHCPNATGQSVGPDLEKTWNIPQRPVGNITEPLVVAGREILT